MELPAEEGSYEIPPMEATGEYQELRSFLNDHMRHLMTTCVEFDSHEQLFWAGTHSGHMTSYYGPNFMKYTAFQAHHEEVRDILTDIHGVLTLSQNQVRYTTKQGLKIFTAVCDEMHSMHQMLRGQGMQDNYVLVAGENEYFFELDLSSGQVYQKSQQQFDPGTVVMKESNHYLCCGQKAGQVTLHDPDRLEVCHTLEAHGGLLSDIDIGGNLLATCGFSARYNHYTVDPYLMVYDLRTLRPFPPVQVPIEPFFVRFMPTYTLRCLVASQSGEFVLCQPDSLVIDPGIYQVNSQGAAIMDCCVSKTHQCLGFGDAAGYAHVWTNRLDDQIHFNHSDQETVFADQIRPIDAFDIDDWSIPLTGVPLPETNEPLLSDWPEHLLKRADRPTPPIDPDILKNMTIRQFVGYAPNPKKKLRNQVAYSLSDEAHDSKYFPESPMNREPGNSIIPKMYRKVEIKYSKYGVEDFNFRHYNQTAFSGLEIHIPNAYCNCMLQSLYFLDIMRISIRNHLCQREFCLACELGILFYMLDISDDGVTCQATNFLRAFRTLPEASALSLLINDNEPKMKSMAQTIQNWNRFVLRQLHLDTKEVLEVLPVEKEKDVVSDIDTESEVQDEKELSQKSEEPVTANEDSDEKPANLPKTNQKQSKFEDPSAVKDLFGIDIMSCRTCKCGTTHNQEVTLFTIDLTYPNDLTNDDEIYPFTKLLQNSMMRKQNTQAWCDHCKKYQPSQQVRKVLAIPDLLNINCQVESSKEIEFWRRMNDLAMPKSQQKPTPNSSPIKTCRYGKYCTRQGCKFLHPGKEGEQVPSSPTEDVNPLFPSVAKHWLPPFIKVYHNKESNEVEVVEHSQGEEKKETDDDENDEDVKEEKEYVTYKLMSNVCHILDPTHGSTLVAHVRVENGYHFRKTEVEKSHWYVFNDFAVTPIAEGEALSFNVDWKIPCILVYMRCDIDSSQNISLTDTIDSKILCADKSLAMRQSRFSRNFTPLNSTEILKEGDIVGMDAEFVTLNQEESEMRRDGTLSTLRPSQMSVARITVVRGWGPLQGVPFIDDYISTSEQVVDYLTKFSGIKPGDLDATVSSKHLTTLKTSYLKLRHLVDAKCIFIGHGLSKDCRVINLVIPRDQVVDTVELFHLPNHRYVSLKFLAWHFLNIKIQAGTHDSAEDAYTAIKLYEKYRELLRAGEWVIEEELEILYDTGRQHNWQPPD